MYGKIYYLKKKKDICLWDSNISREKENKQNKRSRRSAVLSVSVWAVKDCVRIKVGMGRQIFIKRGGGVSGAEPRLPLILRRLALSSPTPPARSPPPTHTHTPTPLPLPPPPSSLSLAFVWLNLVRVWSRASISTCAFIPAEWERERKKREREKKVRERKKKGEREGVLFRVQRKKKIKERLDSKEPRLAAFQSIAESARSHTRPHSHRHVHARTRDTGTDSRVNTALKERALIRNVSPRQNRTTKHFN